MKIRVVLLSLFAVSAAFITSAQVVEYDDMYFNSKDRAKALASKPLTLNSISSEHEVATTINPTDSYSARNVNPEYISQSKVNSNSSAEPAPYFLPDYTPTAVNQNLNSNSATSSNCNCANNPYFGMMPGYGSPYSSFYPSMAMGSMYGYNPYGGGYGGYNSFYNSGWSSMMSIGLGMGMGMGNYYPYGGSSFWNNYYRTNYYGGYGYNSYYPQNVVIINNGDYNSSGVVYGKRSSRSSDVNHFVNPSNRTAAMTATTDTQGRVRGASGRVSSDASSGSYYQSGWRANPATNPTRSATWSDSGSSSGARQINNTRSNNSSFFDSGSSSRSSSNWGGSNSNFSSGGATRSSSGISSGGGGGSPSGGARRGRD